MRKPSARAHSGFSIMSGGARYSRLDEETLSYFRELDSHVKSLADDGDEKEALVSNALSELHGRETEIICDAECSRVVEKLLPHATHAVLKDFCNLCIKDDNLGIICTS